MLHEVIMAGFGGQGIMLIGTLLAYAGNEEGKYVSWLPSYGPEMRGGTANCSICVSDEPIASPVVTEPTAAVVMNLPSFSKFHKAIVPGGHLIINSSMVDVEDTREDIALYRIAANDEAQALGSERVANMICLGVLIGATGAVSLESIRKVLPKVISKRHHDLLPMNEKALEHGMNLARQTSQANA